MSAADAAADRMSYPVDFQPSHKGSFPIAVYRLPTDPSKCFSFQRKRPGAYVCTKCVRAKRAGTEGSVMCIRVEDERFQTDPLEYLHCCEQPLLSYGDLASKAIYRGALQSAETSNHTAAELDSSVLEEIRNLFPNVGAEALVKASSRKKAFNRRRVRKNKVVNNKSFWWSSNAVATREHLKDLRQSIVENCAGQQEQKLMVIDETTGKEIFGMPASSCYFQYSKKVLDSITNAKENNSSAKGWDEFSKWMDELIGSTFLPIGMLTASFKHMLKNAPAVPPELQTKQQQILHYLDEYWRKFAAEISTYSATPPSPKAPQPKSSKSKD